MEHEHLKTFEDVEHLFSGTLTIGEQRKGGTEISFKEKNRRFFVLRCLRQRFLTLSGYKNMKDYKAAYGNPHKTVEQIVVAQHAKVHTMKLPSKKHKQSNVLCILQEKQTNYLEVDTCEELDAWRRVFDDIFTRLGWVQPLPPPASDAPPLPPDTGRPPACTPQYTSNSDRKKVRSGVTKGSVFDLFQPADASSQRYSSPPMTVGMPSNPQAHSSSEDLAGFEEESGQEGKGYNMPGPVHHTYGTLDSTNATQERVFTVQDMHQYVNLPGDSNGSMLHPEPPALPPRPESPLHRRGNTFPGAHLTVPQSDDSQWSCSGDTADKSRRPFSESGESVPTISVTTTSPLSPLMRQGLQHLFDNSENVPRKISMPPLNSRRRRSGNVTPPSTVDGSDLPPDSPVQIRKAGSYNNLTLNLSSRPIPSPIERTDSYETQTLRWEMGHMEGFPVSFNKSEILDALGLVRIADFVWVAGWKKGKSEVSQKLHVGDQLREVNEQIVVDPSVTNRLFVTSASNEIWLIIRRLPHAKVRYLHRTSIHESWGLEVEGNRILNVSKSGPAAEAKLTTRARGAFSERLCDWIITEIDGEPVCLLSKRDQVKNRMDRAGLQMTLVIQPDDFIRKLNTELQKIKFAHEYFVGSEDPDSL